MEANNQILFYDNIPRDAGISKDKYLLKNPKKQITLKRAQYLLKNIPETFGYIGSINNKKPLEIYFTKHKKYASLEKKAGKEKVKLFKNFDDILDYINKKIKKHPIKIKIIQSDFSGWKIAEKYGFK